MRPVRFVGDSLKCLRDFPEAARHDAGYQLDKVQRGEQPDDFKPMPSVGKGVEEIRVLDSSGAYRVITSPDERMPCTFCMLFTKRHNGRRRGILKSRRDDLGNC
jgi:hypothetical protein